jgi:hypothetical protein
VFVKENIESSKKIICWNEKWINYLIDMCQSCQGTMTNLYGLISQLNK